MESFRSNCLFPDTRVYFTPSFAVALFRFGTGGKLLFPKCTEIKS